MPEIIRSLLVVLVIAFFVFKISEVALVKETVSAKTFKTNRNIWFGITAALFLTHNYWAFIFISAGLLFFGRKENPNAIAMVFSMVFAAPLLSNQISGMGIVNFLFEINYFRIVSIVVLVPAYIQLRKDANNTKFGKALPDKFLIAYLIWGLARQIYVDSFTNTMRSVLYIYIDVILPYYVASRSLKNLNAFKEAATFYIIAVLVLSGMGIFEYAKAWLLYSTVPYAIGAEWGLGGYLYRGENLRAVVTTGQAIVLGYVVMIALGFYLWIHQLLPKKLARYSILALLLVGLFSPVSRGPWLGAVLMYLVFICTGENVAKKILKTLAITSAVFAISFMTPYGAKIVDVLPFVGTVDAGNVEYRERLLDNSLIVISRNLWFGSYDFMNTPEMNEMKFTHDGGIIDLVNSYIAIALSGGLFALVLFCGIFVSIVIGLLQSISEAKKISKEYHILGRALLAIIMGIMFTIYTVSSISFIPIIYWIVAGLGLAYIEMIRLVKSTSLKKLAA